MAQSRTPGIAKAYKSGGFKAVWKYCQGHGLKRWLKARNYFRRRAQQVTNNAQYVKDRHAVSLRIDHLRALRQAHRQQQQSPPTALIVSFDGEQLPHWIADILTAARNSGVWSGECISGIRTVAESIALCEAMCGASSCPGRCAGAATNHTAPPTHTGVPYEGAADCTDPYGLEAYCRSHNEPLIGDGIVLPADINHFSHVGN